VYLLFMNAVFGSAPLGLAIWPKAALAVLIVLSVVWIDKWSQRRHSQCRPGEKAGYMEVSGHFPERISPDLGRNVNLR
jgi:hypothetical protein